MAPEFEKYWMVHGPNGGPTKKHTDMAAALAEARRLAEKQDGDFVILEAIAGFRRQPAPVCAIEPVVMPQPARVSS